MSGSSLPRPCIVVRIVAPDQGTDQGSGIVKTFLNPPKDASTVLERLKASGFQGDLQDAEGYSLSSTDPLAHTQEYRLVCPTGT